MALPLMEGLIFAKSLTHHNAPHDSQIGSGSLIPSHRTPEPAPRPRRTPGARGAGLARGGQQSPASPPGPEQDARPLPPPRGFPQSRCRPCRKVAHSADRTYMPMHVLT